jgi:type IV pilus assembly protein PilC
MPKYNYFAKSLDGREKSGIVEVESIEELNNLLKKEGYFLVDAKEIRKREFYFPWTKISLKDKLFFIRNLKVMISAGLSLTKALDTLFSQTKNKKFKTIISNIKKDIEKGESFSLALAKFPKVFPEIFVNMIKAGEETGNLEKSLETLGNFLEKEYEMRSKIIGALVYPAFVICVMIAIGILMLVFVVPKLNSLFADLNVPLPKTTRFVIFLGNFFSKNSIFIIIGLFLFFLFFSYFLKKESGKKAWSLFLLKFPFISSIVKNSNLASISRTFGHLHSVAIPLPQSLQITANILGNFYYKNSLMVASERIKKGEKLSEILKNFGNLYPPVFVEMIAVGEETGETSSILEKMADFYTQEIEKLTKTLSSILEPLIIVFIGIFVGFFVISMIQPLYSLIEGVK